MAAPTALALLAAGVVLLGCAPPGRAGAPATPGADTGDPGGRQTGTPPASGTLPPGSLSAMATMGADAQSLQPVNAALADAATRLGVQRAQLRVERVERREWSDSSLGCPQPGMSYLQVITPGYLVIVAGGSRRLEYHTDARGRAVFCRDAP